MMKIGRRGSLSGTLTAHGRQGHVAYPARADNPIPHLVRLLATLTDAPLDAGTAHFDASNLEIVSLDTGNPAWNVIPATSCAKFNIRFNDLWTPDLLEAELRRRLDAVGHGYTLGFEPCNAPAFLTAPDASPISWRTSSSATPDAGRRARRAAARRTRVSSAITAR